jgi:tRNA-dihydrouridine synthase A
MQHFSQFPQRRFCVAPMMDCTDRHFRYLARLLSRHAMLYTEMITTGALLHSDAARHLAYHPSEHPVGVQLGGSDPNDLAQCARMAADAGYDEVNLNVGCPSDRVQSARFGACLMAEPDLVAECVATMKATVAIPITVKTRLGIDDQDSYEALIAFIQTVAAAGCRTFILHARKAFLKGLNPKENRTVPPLRYDLVQRVKQEMPQLEIIINGGFADLAAAKLQLNSLDGVMLGREVYANPYLLSEVDKEFYGTNTPTPTRYEVLDSFLSYMEQEIAVGTALHHMVRHLLGLFQGQPGARQFRRYLSEHMHTYGAGVSMVLEAAKCVQRQFDDHPYQTYVAPA